jgi:protein-S-isoprenylcysteine O-methyltransferase Ste14
MTPSMAARSTMLAAVNTASNAIKTGLFTLFVPLVVGVGIPQSMVAKEHVLVPETIVWRVVGASLFVLGVIGYFWCAALFIRAQGTPAPISPPKTAVMSGLYRINRNPMYSSVLAVVFGQGLFYQNRRVATYGAFLAVCFHLFVMFYEEPNLRARFDGEYEEFCQRVPRWLPRFHGRTRRR